MNKPVIEESFGDTRQRGLSLIELLVSLALGMILLLGVIEIFVNSKQTYRVQNSLSEMQENARFAVDILVRDLRLAGYLGCGNLNRFEPEVATGITANYTLGSVVSGFENTSGSNWDPTPPTEVTDASTSVPAGANSDIITIQSAGTCTAPLQANMASASGDMTIAATNGCGFGTGDIVIVGDCNSADITSISSASTGGVIAHSGVQRAYNTSAEVINVKNVTYYAAADPDSGIPSLYMFDHFQTPSDNNPVALIEGVESLHILFGEDTDADDGQAIPNVFHEANDVIAWENVISARITLLMRSAEHVGADASEDVNSGINFDDGILRKSFVTTVQLRNRG